MSSPPRFSAGAFAALLAGGIAIGFAGIMMRMSDLNPLASAFWRMALAAPFLWAWAYAVRKDDISGGRDQHFRPALLLAGVFFAGDMGLWHISLHYTSVSNATLLSNSAPIYIALWLWLVHKVRLGSVFLIGLVVALAGAFMLVGSDTAASEGKVLGDLLGVGSGLFYAAYQLVIKDARRQYSTARLMAWSTTITALALLPFALAVDGLFWPATLAAWLPLLGMALIAQIGGQTVIAYASAHLPASLSSVSLLIQPLTASIAAWVLLNEAITPLQMLGGVLLLSGILMARRGS